jgi:hypothetical protein
MKFLPRKIPEALHFSASVGECLREQRGHDFVNMLGTLDVDPLGSRPPGAFLDQLQREFNLKKAKGSIVQRLFGMSYWFGMPIP